MSTHKITPDIHATHLGQKSAYVEHYDATLLQPISRALGREAIGVDESSPLLFHGFDLWTGFELSWLNAKGKPVVGIAEFKIPAKSPFLIESKSFKLFLNSLNQTSFTSGEMVRKTLEKDLSAAVMAPVTVVLYEGLQGYTHTIDTLEGTNIDDLDIEVTNYGFDPEILANAVHLDEPIVEEILSSNLLKSNCLVTYQPDWGSISIKYTGPRINKEALLRYLISFRQHNEFHEQCVERIFTDLCHYCKIEKLSVFARYTRRGGLDINPFRSNFEPSPSMGRLVRQ